MPYVVSRDAKIYYEVRGSGPPLTLVEGLGYAMWMWILQIEDLSRDHMVIAFDNRGVGKSDKPQYPYTMDLFAEDLKAVLDNLGVASAHILGVSMGGMIAQQFALKYPERVRSLILVATHHGGKDIERPPEETLKAMYGPPPPHVKDEKDLYRYKMSYALSKTWIESNKDLFEKLIDLRVREPQPYDAYMNQTMAILGFDASASVSRIECPVLIIHGEADRVVPLSNAFKLHSKIKNSTLIIFKGAGHVVNIERARGFNNIVRRFIAAVERGEYEPVKEPLMINGETLDLPFVRR
ncbi:MAG TPA: alpha/beta hydrolase [Sulfolobales archaeon]|nr:alpha/beta hydrolase [Sulfolobales archaeon]